MPGASRRLAGVALTDRRAAAPRGRRRFKPRSAASAPPPGRATLEQEERASRRTRPRSRSSRGKPSAWCAGSWSGTEGSSRDAVAGASQRGRVPDTRRGLVRETFASIRLARAEEPSSGARGASIGIAPVPRLVAEHVQRHKRLGLRVDRGLTCRLKRHRRARLLSQFTLVGLSSLERNGAGAARRRRHGRELADAGRRCRPELRFGHGLERGADHADGRVPGVTFGGSDRGMPATSPFYTSGADRFSAGQLRVESRAGDKKPRDRVAPRPSASCPSPAVRVLGGPLREHADQPVQRRSPRTSRPVPRRAHHRYAPKMVRGGFSRGLRRLGGPLPPRRRRERDAARRRSRGSSLPETTEPVADVVSERATRRTRRALAHEVEPHTCGEGYAKRRSGFREASRCSRSSRCDAPRRRVRPSCVHAGFAVGCVLLQQIMARHAPGGILSTRVVRTLPLVLERSAHGGALRDEIEHPKVVFVVYARTAAT